MEITQATVSRHEMAASVAESFLGLIKYDLVANCCSTEIIQSIASRMVRRLQCDDALKELLIDMGSEDYEDLFETVRILNQDKRTLDEALKWLDVEDTSYPLPDVRFTNEDLWEMFKVLIVRCSDGTYEVDYTRWLPQIGFDYKCKPIPERFLIAPVPAVKALSFDSIVMRTVDTIIKADTVSLADYLEYKEHCKIGLEYQTDYVSQAFNVAEMILFTNEDNVARMNRRQDTPKHPVQRFGVQYQPYVESPSLSEEMVWGGKDFLEIDLPKLERYVETLRAHNINAVVTRLEY